VARPEAWRAGTPLDVYDTNTIAGAAPGYFAASAGRAGESAAHDREHVAKIVSMAPRDEIVVPVTESDVDGGTYKYDGTVTARQRGTYVLETTAQPFTAKCDTVETPVREVARSETTPTPLRETTPVAPLSDVP
jgi:hypothetical protein